MNPYRGSDQRSQRGRMKPTISRLETDALHRQQRAHAHLSRIRRGPSSHRPRLNLMAGAALAASIAAGLAFGTPLVAAAQSWIDGRPLRLEAISVRGTHRLSLAEIAEATDLPPGAPFDCVDAHEIEQRLNRHDWIENARALWLPTGRLLVEVTERTARAVVPAGVERQAFVVDANGVPFAPAAREDMDALPHITLDGEVNPREASEQLARGVAFAYRLPEFGLPVPTELSISADDNPEGYVLRLPNLAPRVVLGRDDLEPRLITLARLLEANLPAVMGSADLDLRFADQAVLRGVPSPQGAAKAATSRGDAAPSNARPTG